MDADDLARRAGGRGQVRTRPGGHGAEPDLLGCLAAHGDVHHVVQLLDGARVDLCGVAMGQQTEGRPPLDDRQDLQATVAAQVRHHGVSGLVGRNAATFRVGVGGRGGHPHLDVQPGLGHVAEGHLITPVLEGDDQGLVEEVLDHHRRVPQRLGGDLVAQLGVVQVGRVALAGQVVVQQVASGRLGRPVERQLLVEPAGANQGGIQVRRAVGGRDDEDVVVRGGLGLDLAIGREVGVDLLRPPVADPDAGRGCVEALHLDQQLVDHTGGAFAGPEGVGDEPAAVRHGLAAAEGPAAVGAERVGCGLHAAAAHRVGAHRGEARRPHAGPRCGDRVDLLDEADRPTLLAGDLAQGGEVAANATSGRAVPHGLERRGGHEEERHAGLVGHGLCQVGLARAGRPLEQHPSAGASPELAAVQLVAHEGVEGAGDLVDDRVEPDDVGEARLDLLGGVPDVRRAAAHQRHQHRGTQGEDQHHGEQPQLPAIGQGRGLQEVDRVTADDPCPQEQEGDRQEQRERLQPVLSGMLTGLSDVGVVRRHEGAAEAVRNAV